MKRTGIIIISAIAALIIAGLLFCKFYIFDAYDYEPVRVEIPAGTSVAEADDIFKDALGKSFGSKVATLWSWQGGTPEGSHGSYLVNPGDNALEVARRIAKGRQTPVKLTFNNLRFVEELAGKVGRTLELDSADFIAATDSVLSSRFYTYEQWQAGFLPDTYEFYWTASPEEVVTKLNAHAQGFWTPERLALADSLRLSPVDVIIVASIVEEESNRAAEYGKVARLYLNRVYDDLRLQADPTVKFAMRNFALRRVNLHQTKYESPYNTYRFVGLPPGPIRIPEAATIDSVLTSKPHEYYFMCASPDFSGYHVFARTYAEHRINAARYHAALNARGIK